MSAEYTFVTEVQNVLKQYKPKLSERRYQECLDFCAYFIFYGSMFPIHNPIRRPGVDANGLYMIAQFGQNVLPFPVLLFEDTTSNLIDISGKKLATELDDTGAFVTAVIQALVPAMQILVRFYIAKEPGANEDEAERAALLLHNCFGESVMWNFITNCNVFLSGILSCANKEIVKEEKLTN